MQKGGCCGRPSWAEGGDRISYCGRLQNDRGAKHLRSVYGGEAEFDSGYKGHGGAFGEVWKQNFQVFLFVIRNVYVNAKRKSHSNSQFCLENDIIFFDQVKV
jgi:hypothetical protein